MKVIIIGAVAGGATAAVQVRRNDKEARVVVYEKDVDISYSSCGLPYFIGGMVEEISDLVPRGASYFKEKHDIDIRIGHEITRIDPKEKKVVGIELSTGESFEDHYDELIIATGATAVRPNVPGSDLEHVFTLRTVQDTVHIKNYIDKRKPKSAVIVGTGFIGMEMLENLDALGIPTVILARSNRIASHLDEDMGSFLEEKLLKRKADIRKKTDVQEIFADHILTKEGEEIPAELVLFATGIRANTKLAEEAGVAIGDARAIAVNDVMQTNVEHIYACGDCVEVPFLLTGKPVHIPLGTTANKAGKVAGDHITGGTLRFRGILGTSIYKLFDMTIASTGLTEKKAVDNGFAVVTKRLSRYDKTDYFGGKPMEIKAVIEKSTGLLLGVQAIGVDGVDKLIDLAVVAITEKMSGDDVYHLDLSYSPPYSTPTGPLQYLGLLMRSV